MYKHCDPAFSSMDMFGKGYVDPETFANAIPCKRLSQNFNIKTNIFKIQSSDIKEFTNVSNMFQTI